VIRRTASTTPFTLDRIPAPKVIDWFQLHFNVTWFWRAAFCSHGSGGRMPSIAQHEFAKRTDTKLSSGSMEGADTSSNDNLSNRATEESAGKQDTQPEVRTPNVVMSEAAERRSEGTSTESSSDSSTSKASRPSEPVQPMMKMYFTEGVTSMNSNSDSKGAKKAEVESGANSEVERVGGGSNSGVKGKLVHVLGTGQGLTHEQAVSQYDSREFAPSRTYPSKRATWSTQPRYDLQPTVSYASRYRSDSDWSSDRVAKQKPIPYSNRNYQDQYERGATHKPEVIVSSNLIEFPTASMYERQRSGELINSNVLRVQ
jgi:hypothetical protein